MMRKESNIVQGDEEDLTIINFNAPQMSQNNLQKKSKSVYEKNKTDQITSYNEN